MESLEIYLVESTRDSIIYGSSLDLEMRLSPDP
jgi:hypothetical protein